MTSKIAMYSAAIDPLLAIQNVMNLRTRSFPTREEHDIMMRKIEPLLNPVEASSNWRRGVNTGGNTSRKPQSQAGLNQKWKGSTSSLSSQGSEMPKLEAPMPMKYESKFKNSEAAVESTILNTIIMNKLNKFSVHTYPDVRDFLYQILDSGEVNFTKEFMSLVFKKAAAEEIFCPLYAKLLSELRATYPIIQNEMAELFESYLMIFKDITSANPNDYQEFVSKNLEKKYRLGYSQFLAELVILEAVDTKSLEKTVDILITNISVNGTKEDQIAEIHEYADCLLRMTRVFKKKNTLFFINMRKVLYLIVREKLEEILNSSREKFPSIPPKSRFALMDVRDNLQGQ
jgi:hypothetical protein